jgi:chromosome partitioning protein
MFGVANALLCCSFGIKVMTTIGTAVSRYKRIEV